MPPRKKRSANEKRKARERQRELGIPYQKALQQVRAGWAARRPANEQIGFPNEPPSDAAGEHASPSD